MNKPGKLKLRGESVRLLTSTQLDGVVGGRGNSNLTCQGGCASIGCPSHHVSEVAHCTIHTL